MRYFTPAMIFLLALAIGYFSIFGSESHSGLRALSRSLEAQRKENAAAERHVERLKQQVFGVQHDRRELEKAARNELGMARPDELIIIFDRKDGKPRRD
jgi:cell division protein FtsB